MATIRARVLQGNQITAKQVAIGTSAATDITNKLINELSDVNAVKTDNGLLSYDQASDKWVTKTTLDGGTFS